MNSTLASPSRRLPAGVAARFPVLTAAGIAAVAYLALVGAVLIAWQRHATGAVPVTALLVALAPVLLAAACAASSQADRQQYAARLLATVLMAPILLLFWSIDGPLSWGVGLAVALGSVVLHVAAFVGGIVWMARFTTCIAPAPGIAAIDAEALRRRLLSFGTLGLAIDAQRAASGTVRLRWQPTGDPEAWHVVHLQLDVATGTVRVLERVGADGAAPRTADEASMRSIGDDPFDPTRPSAQRGWSRTLQTTMLDAGQLAAAPVTLGADRVVWTGVGTPALPDTNALMACLAAVVVRSGWTWRPQMFA